MESFEGSRAVCHSTCTIGRKRTAEKTAEGGRRNQKRRGPFNAQKRCGEAASMLAAFCGQKSECNELTVRYIGTKAPPPWGGIPKGDRVMKTVFRSFVAELFAKSAHTDVDVWFDDKELVVMVGVTARRFKIGKPLNFGPIEKGQMGF